MCGTAAAGTGRGKRASVDRPERREEAEHVDAGRDTFIDEIASVQRTLAGILQRVDTLPLGDPRFRSCVNRISAEVRRLFALERRFLYPAVREHLARGRAIADRELQDRHRIEVLLAALDGLGPDDPAFGGRLDSLMQAVRCHMARQEEHLFPRLRDAVPARELYGWNAEEAPITRKSA